MDPVGAMHSLQHTKPLFNEHDLLSLENLYTYHTFMEVFKVLKFQSPISIREQFTLSYRNHSLNLILPRVNLDKTKKSFIFKSAAIWNKMFPSILTKNKSENSGIIIPGSAVNSDLSAPMSFVKDKLKSALFALQKAGDVIQWD